MSHDNIAKVYMGGKTVNGNLEIMSLFTSRSTRRGSPLSSLTPPPLPGGTRCASPRPADEQAEAGIHSGGDIRAAAQVPVPNFWSHLQPGAWCLLSPDLKNG